MIAILLALACAKHPDTNMTHLTHPPEVAPAPAFTPVSPEVLALSNGVKLWYVHRPGLPLVSLQLVVPGGSATDPADAPGTASLTDSMLLEGAGDRTSSQFAAESDRLAIDISVATWGVASLASLDTHTDRLDEGLALFADAILRPRFDAADLDRVRESEVGDLKEAADDPRSVSAKVLDMLYYGDGHPLAHPVSGTIAGIEAITVEGLRTSWSQRFGAGHATLVVVGDVDKETLIAALDKHLGSWKGEGIQPSLTAPERSADGAQMYMVDHPGTSQTSLRVVMPAPALGHDHLVPAQLGSIVLGGTFTSRLNRLLREEKGYTYGARARVSAWPSHGTLSASTAVQQDVSAPALKDLLTELERYTEGVDGEELIKARSAKETRTIQAMTARSDVASIYATLAAGGQAPGDLNKGLTQARGTKIADIQAGIQASSLSQAVILVVGDLSEIRESVEAAVPGQWTVVPAPE